MAAFLSFSLSLSFSLCPPASHPRSLSLSLLVSSIQVWSLKLIRNTLLLITHKSCILPSSWFNRKCHGAVTCYKSLSTAFSDGAGGLQMSVAIISPAAKGGRHGDQTMGPTVCATILVPAYLLPIIPSRAWPCAQHWALQRPFFIPWKFPTHPFLLFP